MKKITFVLTAFLLYSFCYAQSPVGKWKKISHTSIYEGQTMDTYAALLTIRPCAAKIFYEINADGIFRLNAASSGCDENYSSMQEKLYTKNRWKVEGNRITISATNFAVGQTYTFTISGNTMTWMGTDGQGTITYQRL